MDNEQKQRVGLNEAVFREVNERLQSFATAPGTELLLDLVCECGDRTCGERIRVARGDYENARADGRKFLVAPGHVFPEVEVILQRNDGWDLIEKHAGMAGEIADATDPRA